MTASLMRDRLCAVCYREFEYLDDMEFPVALQHSSTNDTTVLTKPANTNVCWVCWLGAMRWMA